MEKLMVPFGLFLFQVAHPLSPELTFCCVSFIFEMNFRKCYMFIFKSS